jgi:hypothetical protein
MEKHVTVVAALHIGLGILGIVVGAFIFILLAGIGVVTEDEDALTVLALVGGAVGCFLFVVSAPGLVGGIGLLKRKEWARILVLIVSGFDLLNIPIGTAVGIYSIWALVQNDTIKLFSRAAVAP